MYVKIVQHILFSNKIMVQIEKIHYNFIRDFISG